MPTTNVAIPIPENVDVPILENIHSLILENVNVPIPKNIPSPIPENADIPILENNHISQTQFQKVDLDSLDYDPGACKQIWEYHVNQRDEIRRAYIKNGLHQPRPEKYNQSGKHNRSFQTSWFEYYSTWLEYSPTKDAAYCLPCFVFHNPNGVVGQNTFTVGGFSNLMDSLILYIEKDTISTFSLDSIINDFEDLKERRVPFS